MRQTVDLAERIGHFEIPDRILFSAPLSDMLDVAAEIDALHNDIASVEKEEAAGDIHNILLIIERERPGGRRSHVEMVSRLLRERVERFVRLETAIPELCRDLRLTEGQNHDGD